MKKNYIKSYHYLNGRWLETRDLKISVFDLIVHRGYGIFEVLRAYNSKPFRLNDYLDRFYNSARLLNLFIPVNRKEITEIINNGIRKNNFDETSIKIILSGGISKNGITPSKSSLLIIIFVPSFKFPKKYYQKGIRAITVLSPRLYSGIKLLNQTEKVLAISKALKSNAEEALYIDKKGKIFEGTRSNFFSVIKGELITPKDNVLPGVTRKVVIELAEKIGTTVHEGNIYIKDLQNFAECFITATDKGIVPVVRIDGKVIGNGKVGPLTKRIMKEFKMLTSRV